MAFGASWGRNRFLASCLCSFDPRPFGAPGRLVVDVAPDESLFRDDELDLFDRAGRGATCQCDLDAESRTCLGDASRSVLVQGADDPVRLVDAGLVHCGCAVYFGDGVDPFDSESQRPVVVALVGTCQRSLIRRRDLIAPIAARVRLRLVDRLESLRDSFGDATSGFGVWG